MAQTFSTRGGSVGTARVLSVVAFVLAAVAVFLFPIVFGPLAIIAGVVAYGMGDRYLGKWAIVAGVGGLLLGLLLSYAVYAS